MEPFPREKYGGKLVSLSLAEDYSFNRPVIIFLLAIYVLFSAFLVSSVPPCHSPFFSFCELGVAVSLSLAVVTSPYPLLLVFLWE